MKFFFWKFKLKRIMRRRWGMIPSGTDFNAFRDFYVDGYSPLEAIMEEESCF